MSKQFKMCFCSHKNTSCFAPHGRKGEKHEEQNGQVQMYHLRTEIVEGQGKESRTLHE